MIGNELQIRQRSVQHEYSEIVIALQPDSARIFWENRKLSFTGTVKKLVENSIGHRHFGFDRILCSTD